MMKPSALTTHILDTAAGRPAAGVKVELWRMEKGGPLKVTDGVSGLSKLQIQGAEPCLRDRTIGVDLHGAP